MNRRDLTKMLVAASIGLGGSRKAQANNSQPAKTRNILMPIGDATEAVDTLYPFFRLQEEGFKVTVCGPEARIYHMVTHEVPPNAVIQWDITQEAPGYHITAEKAFKDIRPEEYDGIFVSGGRAPEYLRYD